MPVLALFALVFHSVTYIVVFWLIALEAAIDVRGINDDRLVTLVTGEAFIGLSLIFHITYQLLNNLIY